MIVAVVVIGLLLARTTAGRYMYAAGGNAEAARLAGVRVERHPRPDLRAQRRARPGSPASSTPRACCSAQALRRATRRSTFTVLAGIVVGGTSILGGEGAVWRTVVGVLFIALIGNGYVLLGLDPLYEQITLGVILLLAVGLDALSRRK